MIRIVNHFVYFLLALAGIFVALPTDVVNVLPAEWKPYLAAAIISAGWIKSHMNLFINPDGSNALTAWEGEK